MKRKKRNIGPVVEILLLASIVVVLSFVLKLLGASGYITEAGTFETTLVVVKNIFSSAGISHMLDNSLVNFQTLEPLVLVILSLIAVSILEASGLLKQIFIPLKKIKPKYVTMLVMFVGIISTIIGDYSYALLLPLAGILYKYIGRSSSLGVLTMFIAITIGYGTGVIYNYEAYQLGDITELAAQSITENYNYELLSNIFIMLVSTVALTMVGTIVLEMFAKKYPRNEQTDNLNISKKASRITLIAFILMMILFVYCLIPGLPKSGLLLDMTEPTYIGKLFGASSPLSQGLMFLIIGILMVCGFIYGTVSRNIKNSGDYSNALTKSFEGTGYVLVLIFFSSILYEIIDWTNITTVIATNIVDFIGTSNLTGLILIVVAFLSIVLISIFIPSSIAKWNIIAPIYVPLLMRANISPSFTQMIFLAADSIGKLFSPIYIYLIITIGFMYKYDKDSNTSIISTMKKIMPVVLILSLVWIVIIFGWYLIGLPMGINTSITL
ncbi:MAG: AbgT family transporter [Bacilli bacterium]|nr:AbgT family transporter [Bacilli bacterium]